MYHILPLPIALYEKEIIFLKPNKNSFRNKTRVTIDSRDSVEHIISFKIPKETGGDIPVSVIIFKPNVDHNEFIKINLLFIHRMVKSMDLKVNRLYHKI
jgi:hypothetical protein